MIYILRNAGPSFFLQVKNAEHGKGDQMNKVRPMRLVGDKPDTQHQNVNDIRFIKIYNSDLPLTAEGQYAKMFKTESLNRKSHEKCLQRCCSSSYAKTCKTYRNEKRLLLEGFYPVMSSIYNYNL
ncbi:hypothetical protein MAR_035791 [Mya arenaria]|uniref:Uncharacterized protein n=1 Tax=Mya arenaria TaxID=6604 RepID=A0ABY7EL56_MYAAR|nr:hypothetical protein MAR_035791 [Mya arenaria]